MARTSQGPLPVLEAGADYGLSRSKSPSSSRPTGRRRPRASPDLAGDDGLRRLRCAMAIAGR
jgi:hypothetical protein